MALVTLCKMNSSAWIDMTTVKMVVEEKRTSSAKPRSRVEGRVLLLGLFPNAAKIRIGTRKRSNEMVVISLHQGIYRSAT